MGRGKDDIKSKASLVLAAQYHYMGRGKDDIKSNASLVSAAQYGMWAEVQRISRVEQV
jgi:hypothetical protein